MLFLLCENSPNIGKNTLLSINLKNSMVKCILNNDGKLIAAICAAPWILAHIGILEDLKYTTSIETWKEKHKETFGIEDPFPRGNFVII